MDESILALTGEFTQVAEGFRLALCPLCENLCAPRRLTDDPNGLTAEES